MNMDYLDMHRVCVNWEGGNRRSSPVIITLQELGVGGGEALLWWSLSRRQVLL